MIRNKQTFGLTALLLTLATISATTVVANNQGKAERTASTELEWIDSGFGPQVSPINGDFSKDRHITYVKFTAGMTTPLHTHSHDYVGIVITGVTRHWEPGKPESKKELSTGAHWFIPANVQHVSECLAGTECIMALYQQQAMDFLPVQ